MNRRDEQVRAIIAHEAGDWFVAHRTGTLDGAEQRAFDAWVMASPIHVEEYLGVALIAGQLSEAAVDPEMPLEAILERARQADATGVSTLGTIAPSKGAIEVRPRTAVRWQLAAAAASLTVLVSALLWWGADRSVSEHYATRHGELRIWRLADNSVLRLNTDSAVTVRYSRAERILELDHGQAFFEVTHEANRRFVVVAGHATVTAVGTAFDVYRRGASTVVTVLQGQVAVSAARVAPGATADVARWMLRVSAGEVLRVAGDALPEPPAPAPVERSTAWLHRQILVEREPLAAVVAEFNRYGVLPIELEAPALRTLLISGVFTVDDTDTFIAFLRTLDGVSVEVTPTRIRVLLRPTATRADPAPARK